MSRTAINFILDTILAVVFLATMTIAAITRYVFPPVIEASGWSLFGFSLDAWTRLQFWMLFAFGVLALIHVMLHWSWVTNVALRYISQWRGKKTVVDEAVLTLVGVAVLVAILHIIGGVVLASMLLIEEPTASPASFSPVSGSARTTAVQ
jgi:hypothetical protein